MFVPFLPGRFPQVAALSPSAGGPTDPHFANVVLLCGFDGADGATTTTDDSPSGHTLTFNLSGVELDTAQQKFGSASLTSAGGAGRRVTIPDSADWNFGSGAFTIEAFCRWNTDSNNFQMLFGQWDTTNNQKSWAIFRDGSGDDLELFLSSNGSTTTVAITADWVLSTGTWYHICADFDGTKYRLYIDGVMVGSSTSTLTLHNSTAAFSITNQPIAGSIDNFVGWIDELRITKGVARYASDGGFSVPTAAFPRS